MLLPKSCFLFSFFFFHSLYYCEVSRFRKAMFLTIINFSAYSTDVVIVEEKSILIIIVAFTIHVTSFSQNEKGSNSKNFGV